MLPLADLAKCVVLGFLVLLGAAIVIPLLIIEVLGDIGSNNDE